MPNALGDSENFVEANPMATPAAMPSILINLQTIFAYSEYLSTYTYCTTPSFLKSNKSITQLND